MKEIRFLTIDEIKAIHKNQIELYGGTSEIRDENLLLSAIAMPNAGYSDRYFHSDLFQMAGAYCYHICQNHPFVDGNKRTALASALVFLDLNGIMIFDNASSLYEIVLSVAEGKINKIDIADCLRRLANKK